jgi:hypothetical protein
LHPTHAIKASELDQGRSLFLAQQNKNRLTLEATDDLGTLIVDPMSGNVRFVLTDQHLRRAYFCKPDIA